MGDEVSWRTRAEDEDEGEGEGELTVLRAHVLAAAKVTLDRETSFH